MADDTPEVAPTLGVATNPEIARQTLEQLRAKIDAISDTLQETMRRSQPPQPTGWGALRAEWSKPSGIIPLAGLILSCALGGIGLYNAIEANTKTNAAQAQILEPLPRLIERLSDRMEAGESRQREELLAWREWRKAVDQSMQATRDNALSSQSNSTEIKGLDTRISRVVELFQSTMKELAEKQEAATRETNQKLERILIEQAQVRTRLEGRAGAQPPFLESPTWRGFPDPFILRAVLRPAFLRGWIGSGRRPF
ncbi:hypothetical protein [Methylopila sp. 73B]|uniref:hypothetical protein n=1 Tax=Methylopila sp. 73B TaxID=1120792 RepID=UPI00037E264D|nr:hypothetical protein [Methylopila sp. 73B]